MKTRLTHRCGNMLKSFFLFLIKAYQLIISPLFPPTCRFTPTCSQYSMEAINRHGISRGLYMTVRRLLRCHPFHSGGYDPVD